MPALIEYVKLYCRITFHHLLRHTKEIGKSIIKVAYKISALKKNHAIIQNDDIISGDNLNQVTSALMKAKIVCYFFLH